MNRIKAGFRTLLKHYASSEFKQLFRFISVGIINTIIGYGAIFACMYLANLSPEISNVIGYMLGLLASYWLHRRYTFRSTKKRGAEFLHFIAVFLIAYCTNLASLVFMINALGVGAALSQVIAGAVYVATSYMLNKCFVFRSSSVG